MRLKRLKQFAGPSSGTARALVFLGLLMLGGLIWDQLITRDSNTTEPEIDAFSKSAPSQQAPGATPDHAVVGDPPAGGTNRRVGVVKRGTDTQTAPHQAVVGDSPQPGTVGKANAEEESQKDAATIQGHVVAGDLLRRGTISKVDEENETLTIRADAQELVLRVGRWTRVLGRDWHSIETPFDDGAFKVGTGVVFKANAELLMGLRLLGDASKGEPFGHVLPEGLRQGRIVSIQPEKLKITIRTSGQDIEALVTEETKFFGVPGNGPQERLQTLKAGGSVSFLVRQESGKNFLVGVKKMVSR